MRAAERRFRIANPKTTSVAIHSSPVRMTEVLMSFDIFLFISESLSGLKELRSGCLEELLDRRLDELKDVVNVTEKPVAYPKKPRLDWHVGR